MWIKHIPGTLRVWVSHTSVSSSHAAGKVSVENCCPKRHAYSDVLPALCKLERHTQMFIIVFGKYMLWRVGSDMTRPLSAKHERVFGTVIPGHGVCDNEPFLPVLWSISGLGLPAGPSVPNTPHTQKYTPKVPCSIATILGTFPPVMVVARVEKQQHAKK